MQTTTTETMWEARERIADKYMALHQQEKYTHKMRLMEISEDWRTECNKIMADYAEKAIELRARIVQLEAELLKRPASTTVSSGTPLEFFNEKGEDIYDERNE